MISGGLLLPPMPPLVSSAEGWRARRWLGRLERELRARGWGVTNRCEANPPLLLVYSVRASHVGESLTVFRGPVDWWFMTCTGHGLAPCIRVQDAATEVGTFMEPLVSAALRLSRVASPEPPPGRRSRAHDH